MVTQVCPTLPFIEGLLLRWATLISHQFFRLITNEIIDILAARVRCCAPFSHQRFSLYVKSMNHYILLSTWSFEEHRTTAKCKCISCIQFQVGSTIFKVVRIWESTEPSLCSRLPLFKTSQQMLRMQSQLISFMISEIFQIRWCTVWSPLTQGTV